MHTYEKPTELTIGLASGWECSINGSWLHIQDASTSPQSINGVVSLGLGTKYRLWTVGLSAQRIFAKKYTVFAETYSTPEVAPCRHAVIHADGGLLLDFSDRDRLNFLCGRGFRPGCAEFYANVGFLLSLGPTKPAN